MRLDAECVGCIVDQSLRVARAIGADEALTQKIYSHVQTLSKEFSFSQTPPEIAAYVYADMAKLAGMQDLYGDVKVQSTLHAQSFLPLLDSFMQESQTPYKTATKIAIAGNVIDLAAKVNFDLTQQLETLLATSLGVNDVQKLEKELKEAQSLLYIGDNAGEHIFDKFYLEVIIRLFPQLSITYLTRGMPIINDITYQEALNEGLDTIVSVVDSGVDTPGLVLARANEETQKLFKESDVIISKGMGNYETLNDERRSIFFLLKVKCNVVARSLGLQVGELVCKYHTKGV